MKHTPPTPQEINWYTAARAIELSDRWYVTNRVERKPDRLYVAHPDVPNAYRVDLPTDVHGPWTVTIPRYATAEHTRDLLLLLGRVARVPVNSVAPPAPKRPRYTAITDALRKAGESFDGDATQSDEATIAIVRGPVIRIPIDAAHPCRVHGPGAPRVRGWLLQMGYACDGPPAPVPVPPAPPEPSVTIHHETDPREPVRFRDLPDGTPFKARGHADDVFWPVPTVSAPRLVLNLTTGEVHRMSASVLCTPVRLYITVRG